jgi:hypothetical protein
MSGDHNMRGEDHGTVPLPEYTVDLSPKPIYYPVEPIKHKYAGFWVIDNTPGFQTKFSVKKRPSEEHIKNHLELLGWIWEDAK